MENNLNASEIAQAVAEVIEPHYDETYTTIISKSVETNCKLYAIDMIRVFMIKTMSKDVLNLYKQYLPNELKDLYDG